MSFVSRSLHAPLKVSVVKNAPERDQVLLKCSTVLHWSVLLKDLFETSSCKEHTFAPIPVVSMFFSVHRLCVLVLVWHYQFPCEGKLSFFGSDFQ